MYQNFLDWGESKWRPNKEQPEKEMKTPIPFTKRAEYLGTDLTKEVETYTPRTTHVAEGRAGPSTQGHEGPVDISGTLHGDLILTKTPITFLQKWEGQPSKAYEIARTPEIARTVMKNLEDLYFRVSKLNYKATVIQTAVLG